MMMAARIDLSPADRFKLVMTPQPASNDTMYVGPGIPDPNTGERACLKSNDHFLGVVDDDPACTIEGIITKFNKSFKEWCDAQPAGAILAWRRLPATLVDRDHAKDCLIYKVVCRVTSHGPETVQL